jgi:type IV pilus assembly protein PilW
MNTPRTMRCPQAGMSMIELMIAITLGLMILAGLAVLFANASNSQHELRRTAQQIENGRYAMDVLIQDLQLAGFFGEYRANLSATALPDPCVFAIGDLTTAIRTPIQGYAAASLTAQPVLPATCVTWLPPANLSPGSDVLVVRRADTQNVPIGTATTAGNKFLQSSSQAFEVQDGGGVTSCTSKADGTAPTAVTRRCQFPASTDICPADCTAGVSTAGYLRALRVHVYFVAPCNRPPAGTTTCTASSDNGRPIPTLKRLELARDAGTGQTTFQFVPIAEGVEFMKLAYGIDDVPGAPANSETGRIGDGAPDRYVLAPTPAEFGNAATARVDLLVRHPEPSPGQLETKTYNLSIDPITPTAAGVAITPADVDRSYRRHVYNAEVRLVNLSSRKEIP